ncbi:hypothetical protein [Fibrobacter sp.]
MNSSKNCLPHGNSAITAMFQKPSSQSSKFHPSSLKVFHANPSRNS